MHLPVGVSDFRTLVEYKAPNGEGYLFVDKSLLIKEIIYDLTKVILITRPRRFGKTLNLSMLHHFFAKTVNSWPTIKLFNNLKIAKDKLCMRQQGKYSVIFISFKDVKYNTFALCYEYIKDQIINVYAEYKFLLKSARLTEEDKKIFEYILTGTAKETYWHSSLKLLTEFIYKATSKQVIILLDEYDTPIQEAYLNNYYEDILRFYRNFLSEVLKDNPYLKQATLTGILRVAKESLFSGLNNLKVYSVLHEKYANHFGFTEEEINNLLARAKLSLNIEQLTKTKEWYNGYNFGGAIIYNPCSIIEFIQEKGTLRPYWVNTSGNYLTKNLIVNSSEYIQTKLRDLMAGKTIKEYVDEHVVFTDLNQNIGAVWSFLLMTGYLKAVSMEINDDGELECELAIPNKEIESLYKKIIREWLSGDKGIVWYKELLSDLTAGKINSFEHKLQDIIIEMASYHDTKKTIQENFYHGLMLGLLAGLKDNYEVRSNRESGLGRYDLLIMPKDINKLGIIMEFKALYNATQITETAKAALEQITKSAYTAELKARGINNICAMGIAFVGKIIKVESEFNFK